MAVTLSLQRSSKEKEIKFYYKGRMLEQKDAQWNTRGCSRPEKMWLKERTYGALVKCSGRREEVSSSKKILSFAVLQWSLHMVRSILYIEYCIRKIS